jgi:hypothetical protein
MSMVDLRVFREIELQTIKGVVITDYHPGNLVTLYVRRHILADKEKEMLREVSTKQSCTEHLLFR